MADTAPELNKKEKVVGDQSRLTLLKLLGIEEHQLADALQECEEAKKNSERTNDERITQPGIQGQLRHSESVSKALHVLGVSPSNYAIMKRLGISEEEVEAAMQQLAEQKGEDLLKSSFDFKSTPDYLNKKSSKKALEVMGEDPVGMEKIKKQFGFKNDHVARKAIAEAQKSREEIESNPIEVDEPSQNITNKAASKKALSVLGIDKSQTALMKRLGLNEQELDGALQKSSEIWVKSHSEAVLSTSHAMISKIDVESNAKALEILGTSPKKIILMKKFGIDEQEVDVAVKQAEESRSNLIASREINTNQCLRVSFNIDSQQPEPEVVQQSFSISDTEVITEAIEEQQENEDI